MPEDKTELIAKATREWQDLPPETKEQISYFWKTNISIGHKKLGRLVLGTVL